MINSPGYSAINNKSIRNTDLFYDIDLLHPLLEAKVIDHTEPSLKLDQCVVRSVSLSLLSIDKDDPVLAENGWCVIQLGTPGSITGFWIDIQVDTNAIGTVKVDAIYCPTGNIDESKWVSVLQVNEYNPSQNVYQLVSSTPVFTHIRLSYSSGGRITKFRAYGKFDPVFSSNHLDYLDMAYIGNGGRVVYSDKEDNDYPQSIILPNEDRSVARSNFSGSIIRLFKRGCINKVEVKLSQPVTKPSSLSIKATNSNDIVPMDFVDWATVLHEVGNTHTLITSLFDGMICTHVKVICSDNCFIERIRVWGSPDTEIPSILPSITISDKHIIHALPLTSEGYAPYGEVIQAGGKSNVTSANQGTAEKFHHVAQLTNTFPKHNGKMNLCVFHCRPTPQLPFRVKLLERHPYSSQAFIPMSDKQFREYLVIVALNGEDDRPDMSTLKAFIALSSQGINYRQGVWHHPMVVLDHPCDFTVIVHESGIPEEDCQEVTVDEVIIEMPGFHVLK
ncbi:ureidoglycolate hydrolase-domain-containing protein [Pilobolus umbonatus]|nr:ureidoglycolate hydrolase-domain-containing protein [Pilobolus umbonatus]